MKLAAQPESHEESFHRPSELRTSFAPMESQTGTHDNECRFKSILYWFHFLDRSYVRLLWMKMNTNTQKNSRSLNGYLTLAPKISLFPLTCMF